MVWEYFLYKIEVNENRVKLLYDVYLQYNITVGFVTKRPQSIVIVFEFEIF